MSSSTSLLHPPPHSTNPQAITSSPLETLLSHLLASKRSLSSITHVWRANEICTSTRASLENSAFTTARTSFLRSGITSQLGVLQQVQRSTEATGKQGKAGFEAVVRDLDEADARLTGTLEKLRETLVEAGLRPEGEARRSLLDFVDEGGVEGLTGAIKEAIDEAGKELEDFQEGNRGFQNEIGAVRRLLDEGNEDKGAKGHKRSPIPEVLHEMEDHAREMAVNLESLVSHFDLCVTAIKHTEGGGDAASKLAGDLPEGVDIGQDAALPEPVSDEQRDDMLRILEQDAEQVEDVVMEIRDHISEMEALHSRVEAHTNQLSAMHSNTTNAFRLLEDLGQKLPGYATRNQIFLMRWDGERAKIEERLEELEGLRDFYDGFLRAYDNLLIEIGRRKDRESKMEKVVQEARAQLQSLYDDELGEREIFRTEQGDFLPVDIWPGLMAEPLQFAVSPLGDITAKVPDISKSVIHRAIRRVHGDR